MSNTSRRIHDLQQVYVRQSIILRENLLEFDRKMYTGGENWPSMLGRLNAAMNQTMYADQSIEDSLDHFAIEPKKCVANPSDVPFFLSVRIVDEEVDTMSAATMDRKCTGAHQSTMDDVGNDFSENNKNEKSPIKHVYKYEKDAALFAREFEDNMEQF